MSFVHNYAVMAYELPARLAVQLQMGPFQAKPKPNCSGVKSVWADLGPTVNVILGFVAFGLAALILGFVVKWAFSSGSGALGGAVRAVVALVLISGLLWTLLSSLGVTTCF